MRKYLIIDIIIMLFMGIFILIGEGDFIAVSVFIITFVLAISIIVYMKAANKRRRKIQRIEDMIDSGEYKVYLDGQLVADPQGIDISMYKININHQKKIIRFTTVRQTNVYVDRF